MALRARESITIDELFGVDLSESETRMQKGRFRHLENLVPLGLRTLQRKPGSTVVVNQSPFIQVVDNLGNPVLDNADNPVVISSGITPIGLRIVKLHTFVRVGFPTELLAIIQVDTTTFKLVRLNVNSWTVIGSWTLPNTTTRHDTATWQGKVIITTGQTINGSSSTPLVYDGSTVAAFTGTNMPTRAQYVTVYQERVILAGGPDSRHRVWFSDPLVSNFQATSFHDVRVGTGGEVSGLGVNSITTSDQGAQNQLAILKTDAVATIFGELGSGNEILTVRSIKVGCPSHKTIVNSPFGLIFTGNDSVYILDQGGGEPIDIGAELGSEIRDSGNLSTATGEIFNGFYHLSIAAPGQVVNSREWMLSLNPHMFPQQRHWYGPHTGDKVSDYTVFSNQLHAAEEEITSLWRMMTPGSNLSMSSQVRARSVKLITPKITTSDLRATLFDAVGMMVSGSRVTVTVEVSPKSQLLTSSGSPGGQMTWDTSSWDVSVWAGTKLGPLVVRPRLRGTNIQVTLEHQTNESFELHSIYIRHKPIRRQQESL